MSICYWDEDEQCYVCDSAIFRRASGMGETPQEARDNFDIALDRVREDFENGSFSPTGFAEGDSRNIKRTITVQAEVSSATDQILSRVAGLFRCTTDQAIEYLAHYYEHSRLVEKEEIELDPDDPDLLDAALNPID